MMASVHPARGFACSGVLALASWLLPGEVAAQRLAAALPLPDTSAPEWTPVMNASGRHVVAVTAQPLTPDDVDPVRDAYVYTVATYRWQRLPRASLIGLHEAVDTALITPLSLSDDGRYLAYTVTRQPPPGSPLPARPDLLARFDVFTGQRTVVRDASADPFRLPVMSRDGSTFAWIGDRNAVIVADVGARPLTIGETCPASQAHGCPFAPAVTADGERVLYLRSIEPFGPVAHLEVFDRARNARAAYPQVGQPSAPTFAVTATGGHVYLARNFQDALVLDLVTGRTEVVRVGGMPSRAAISDDGRYLAAAAGGVYDRGTATMLWSGGERTHGMSADGRIVAVDQLGTFALLDLDGDGDGMRDPWETAYRLDPTSAADGDADTDGDGLSNREEYARGSHPRGRYRRYYAEGVSSSVFDTTLYLHTTSDWYTNRARVTATFIGDDGGAASVELAGIFPLDSPRAARLPGLLRAMSFGIVLEGEEPLVGERLTTWGGGVPLGAHASAGAAAPSTTWVFAEGSTRGRFEVFFALLNPGRVPASLTATFLCADREVVRSYWVPAHARRTIWVDREGAPLDDAECGAVFESTAPVVMERSMYLEEGGRFTAGTSAVGEVPGEHDLVWHIADVTTAGPFDTFLALVNPGAQQASAEVTYRLPSGDVVVRTHVLPARSRVTVWVDREDPELADAVGVSARVASAAGPIAVERATWWSRPGALAWTEGHAEPGLRVPARRWGLAHVPESATVAILNVADVGGVVRLTLFKSDGVRLTSRELALTPGRTAIRLTELWPALPPNHYALEVESVASGGAVVPVPLVVERTSYAPGLIAGTSLSATPLPVP